MASHQRVDVTLIYVVEVMQSMPLDAELPHEISRGEQVLADAERRAGAGLDGRCSAMRTELLQARSAGAAIVDEAIEHQAHAIVLGASVRKKMGRLTTGETLEYVLVNAPCEVIVIRHALDLSSTDPRDHQ
jgi:nucleotide-binding universal stress UspA family protein